MNQIKEKIIHKLNAILELTKHCATKALITQNPLLMQEVALALVTHEGLCKLAEQEGSTANVIKLLNELGKAIAELYTNIINFKLPAEHVAQIKLTQFNTKQTKNMLN